MPTLDQSLSFWPEKKGYFAIMSISVVCGLFGPHKHIRAHSNMELSLRFWPERKGYFETN